MSTLGLNLTLVKPVITLAGWTFVMEAWMYATRIPALSKYGVDMDPGKVKQDMNTKIPIAIRQIAEYVYRRAHAIPILSEISADLIPFAFSNYNHLHEQPQVFYAVALALALLGDKHGYTEKAAWTYVGLRIGHSLFQSLANVVMVRFQLFLTSSVVLAGLTGRAALLAFK